MRMRNMRRRRAAYMKRMRAIRAKRLALARKLRAARSTKVVKAAPAACTTCGAAAPVVTMTQHTYVVKHM
jgi:hypothetical protein